MEGRAEEFATLVAVSWANLLEITSSTPWRDGRMRTRLGGALLSNSFLLRELYSQSVFVARLDPISRDSLGTIVC